jgi:hypothetical protein
LGAAIHEEDVNPATAQTQTSFRAPIMQPAASSPTAAPIRREAKLVISRGQNADTEIMDLAVQSSGRAQETIGSNHGRLRARITAPIVWPRWTLGKNGNKNE